MFEQKWFQGTWDRSTLERDVWDPNWLYLHKENIAPLLIGEWAASWTAAGTRSGCCASATSSSTGG